jgi:UDP-N-acetylmuramoyl-tripeptide--D-alanyl-D-alanine ligase
MGNVPVEMDEIYRVYKNSKSVKLPSDAETNKIEPGDLYFAWKLFNDPSNLGFLMKNWRNMELYTPLLLKPIIALLKKYTNYSTYVVDGNAYAKKAIKMGANYAIIDDTRIKNNYRYLFTKNTRAMVCDLVAFHRKKVNIPFVGITGTCGKTTTKELIKSVLSAKYTVESNMGNLNSPPLLFKEILNFAKNTELGIIELAGNSFYNFKRLCEIVQPHCGLITCIGKGHLDWFKSIEGVLKIKRGLFDYISSVKGHIFKNLNDSKIANLVNDYKHTTTYGSINDADVYGQIVDTSPFLTIKWHPSKNSRQEYFQVTTKLYGHYNLDNILSAIAVGLYYDIPPKLINEAIQEYETINLRSQIQKIGTNSFILDSGSATPTSMIAALNSFYDMNVEKKIAILGDIAYLGKWSIQEHHDIIIYTKNLNFDITVFVGKEFQKARDHDFGLYFANPKTARKWLKEQNIKNSHILLKSSRPVGIERIIMPNYEKKSAIIHEMFHKRL